MPLWAWGVALGVGLGIILYLRHRAAGAAASTIPSSTLGSAYTPLDNAASGGGPPSSPNTGAAGIDPTVVSGWLSDFVGGITATSAAALQANSNVSSQALGLVAQSEQSLVDALGYETALSGYAVTGALNLAGTTTEGAFALAGQAIAVVGAAAPPSVSNPSPPSNPNQPPPASQPPAPPGHPGTPPAAKKSGFTQAQQYQKVLKRGTSHDSKPGGRGGV
jgi:hypothetical protein